ncbi:MAG: PAS domain S-box protein [Bacteroidota bacterium]
MIKETNKKLLDENPDAILTLTPDGNVVYWNKGAENIFGYSKQEAIGHPLSNLILLSERNTEEELKIGETIRSGICNYGSIHRKKDGSLVYIDISNKLIEPSDGSPAVILSSRKDVTRVKVINDIKLMEAKLGMIFESMPEGLIMVNSTGHIILANSQVEKMFGYQPADLKGNTIEGLLPERFRHGHIIHRLNYIVNPHARPMGTGLELYGLKNDGSEFPVEISLSPLTIDEDSFIISAIRDITERKRTETNLRQSEEHFRRLITDVEDYAIYMVDLIGNIMTWNAGAQKIKGYPPEEIIGKHFSLFYTSEDLELGKPTILLQRALEYGRYEEEGWRVKKDGSQFWANVIATTLRDEKGNAIGFTKVTRDRSERKRAEEELKERTIQVEAANKELEAFSYSVSHDLRAPLRAVDGFSRMLLEDYGQHFDEEGRRRLDVIRHNVQSMGDLIDDLLEFSRLGRQELKISHINMLNLVHEVYGELSSRVPDRNIQLALKEILPAFGDQKLIRQVLVNLISNAIKFTGKQPNAMLEIGSMSNETENIYFVKDNGAGFDEHYADKLFGVFQRLHSNKDFDGTGVGLAIVHRIIHRHGGRVWGTGKLDSGATFYFTLPEKGSPNA